MTEHDELEAFLKWASRERPNWDVGDRMIAVQAWQAAREEGRRREPSYAQIEFVLDAMKLCAALSAQGQHGEKVA